MALTQQRMLELLTEAKAFADDYEMLAKDIRAILSSSMSSDGMKDKLIERMRRPLRPRVKIVIEQERYAMTHARNEWNMKRKALGREEVRVKRERPRDYVEPQDATDELFAGIEQGRDKPKPEYTEPANAPESSSDSINPPKPSFWEQPEQRAEPRISVHEALEIARVADEMEARRIRQEELDKEAMK